MRYCPFTYYGLSIFVAKPRLRSRNPSPSMVWPLPTKAPPSRCTGTPPAGRAVPRCAKVPDRNGRRLAGAGAGTGAGAGAGATYRRQSSKNRRRCRGRSRSRRGGGPLIHILNDTIHRHPHSTAHIYSSFFALPNVDPLTPINPGIAAKLNPRCGNRRYGQK